MNKETVITQAIILFILTCLVIFVMMSYLESDNDTEIKEAHAKIKSLETKLAIKTQHYEWLEEITNSLLDENPAEFKEKFKQFLKQEETNPHT